MEKLNIDEISGFMSRYWNLMKAHWIPEDNDEYWKAMYDAAGDTYKGEDEFCRALVLLFGEYAEWKLERSLGRTKERFVSWLYKRRGY